MAKSNASLTKTDYPDLSDMFAEKEQSRLERAKESPRNKLIALGQIQELSRILKSAKIVKKGVVGRD